MREQRAEDVHRHVAALHTLGEVHAWQPPRLRLIHASGARYSWALPLPADLEEIPELPAGILDKLIEKPAPAALSSDGEKIREGGRNDYLARFAGRLRRPGLSAQAIEAALRVENAERCDPPLPEPEVRAIARSIGRYAPEPEARRLRGNGHDPEPEAL